MRRHPSLPLGFSKLQSGFKSFLSPLEEKEETGAKYKEHMTTQASSWIPRLNIFQDGRFLLVSEKSET